MTLIILSKAKDGVVLSADSLAIFGRGVNVKKHLSKIVVNQPLRHVIMEQQKKDKHHKRPLDFEIAVSGAGVLSDIMKFATTSSRNFMNYSISESEKEYSPYIVNRLLEDSMLELIKRYNVEIPNYLSGGVVMSAPGHFGSQIATIYRIEGKTGGVTLFPVPNGLEILQDYQTLGSGAAYAELLLKNIYSQKMDVIQTAIANSFVISHVSEINPEVGNYYISFYLQDNLKTAGGFVTHGNLREPVANISKMYNDQLSELRNVFLSIKPKKGDDNSKKKNKSG